MTMTTHPDSAARLVADYFERMTEIDALGALARGDVSAVRDLRSFSDQERAKLETGEGRVLVARWARAFSRSIDLLVAFRDAEISSPKKATEDQLIEIMEGADKVLAALRKRLRKTD